MFHFIVKILNSCIKALAVASGMGLCPHTRPLLFAISHKTPPDSLQDIAPSKKLIKFSDLL